MSTMIAKTNTSTLDSNIVKKWRLHQKQRIMQANEYNCEMFILEGWRAAKLQFCDEGIKIRWVNLYNVILHINSEAINGLNVNQHQIEIVRADGELNVLLRFYSHHIHTVVLERLRDLGISQLPTSSSDSPASTTDSPASTCFACLFRSVT